MLVHVSIAVSISVLLNLECLLTVGRVESICLYLSHLACLIDGLGLIRICIVFSDIIPIIGMWPLGVSGPGEKW